MKAFVFPCVISIFSPFPVLNSDEDFFVFPASGPACFPVFLVSHFLYSEYDAGLGPSQPDTINYINFPLILKEIEIETPYYTYHSKNNNENWLKSEGTFKSGIFRGLVDFKYEVLE